MNTYSYFCCVMDKAQSKEEHIFKATLSLVGKVGLSGLSMEAVAKEAKIATGTVYIYFKSKEELLNKLYIHVKLKFASAVSGRLQEGLPFKVQFKNLCLDYLDYLSKHHAEMVFMQQFMNSPFVAGSTMDVTNKSIAPFVQLLEKGKKELLLKDIDSLLMIAFLHGALSEVSGFLKKRPREMHSRDIELICRNCWDALSA